MTTTDERTSSSWNFNDMGPEFDEHVAAHLPGYADVQRLIGLISSIVIPPSGGVFADLGASTGRTAHEIMQTIPDRGLSMHLYDADASMLDEAAQRVPNAHLHHVMLPAELSHEDAHLTVALWLLQFLTPADRVPVLRAARRRASDRGLMIIGTKTVYGDQRWQEFNLAALDDYKAEHGVDPASRAAKTVSLRGVMQAPTVSEVMDELLHAGWHSPAILWRWYGWTLVGGWASPAVDDDLSSRRSA